jgi:LmbE family N-acetylglucosaminyl deacetylase
MKVKKSTPLDWIPERKPRDPRVGRIFVVGAHPDDEVIGAGVLLSIFHPGKIYIVTQGAPENPNDAREAGYSSQEAYAEQRKREKLNAMRVAGIPFERCEELPFVDQNTPRELFEITLVLVDQILLHEPDWIFTHPYEGGHPDHDSTAFAVHAAVELLREHDKRSPRIVEFTSYHSVSGKFRSGEFAGAGPEWVLRLTPAERDRKRKMFDCFSSQQSVLAQFEIGEERFRMAPAYDFRAPPLKDLYYDSQPWAWKSPQWLSMARDTIEQLGIRARRF